MPGCGVTAGDGNDDSSAYYNPKDSIEFQQLRSYVVDDTDQLDGVSGRATVELLSGLCDDPDPTAEIESYLEKAMREVAN